MYRDNIGHFPLLGNLACVIGCTENKSEGIRDTVRTVFENFTTNAIRPGGLIRVHIQQQFSDLLLGDLKAPIGLRKIVYGNVVQTRIRKLIRKKCVEQLTLVTGVIAEFPIVTNSLRDPGGVVVFFFFFFFFFFFCTRSFCSSTTMEALT